VCFLFPNRWAISSVGVIGRPFTECQTFAPALEKLSLKTIGHNCPRAGRSRKFAITRILNFRHRNSVVVEHVCRGPLHRRKIWRQTTSSARTVMRKFGGIRHPHKHKSRQQCVIFLGQQARRKRNTSQLIWTIRAIQAQQTTGSSTYHIPPPRRNSTKDDLAQTTEHNNLLRQQQLNSTSSTPPITIPTDESTYYVLLYQHYTS